MVERIALHQTRLHTPGLGLDPKGVALGAKGLILLPSIDRLVMLLTAYTREHSLEHIVPTLAMNLLKSKLGTREIAFEFAAESSDRMDRMADIARLVGGIAFTGTSRHFVQYRDSTAPFGYDAPQLVSTEAPYALYHDRFSQTYDLERRIDLRTLLLRLMPRVDPSTKLEPGVRFLVTEQGLGPAAVQYLMRSRVEGDVCVAEWPPESALDDSPVRRWVMRIPQLPERMRQLVHTTPGITCFVPAGPGVVVESGYRHPVELRACPVFDTAALVLLRGRGGDPWVIDRMAPMAPLSTFAPVEVRTKGGDAADAVRTTPAAITRIPLRVVPSSARWRDATATWIPPEELPLFRRLAYALPRAVVAKARVAVTTRGAFVRLEAGIESMPLGVFFVEVHPNLYLAAGYQVTPALAPDVVARAFGAAPSQVLFVGTDGKAWAVEENTFATLESVLLEAPPWEPLAAQRLEQSLSEALIELKVVPVGPVPKLTDKSATKAGG
ncbi:MAG: hypothetical protein WBY94_28100 [Polyangiaceae bacterium]